MPRNQVKSQETREKIRNLYIYQGLSERGIVDRLNGDPEFIRKYSQISLAGVHYHIVRIRADFERSVSEDALDRYVADFIRLRERMDGEIDELNRMLANPNIDEELKLKIMRMKHDINIDQMKMLQDIELPISVKKLKRERTNKLGSLKIIKEDKVPPIEFTDYNGDNVGTNPVQDVSEEQDSH